MTISAVIPAAGKGTRLAPLTDRTPKEMLPLGGHPTIRGALLEVEAAGIREVVVVLGPHKESLRPWLEANRPPNVILGFASQPSPVGVLDAIARGRAMLGGGAFAVLYPDWIALPDQRALRALVEAHARTGGSAIGLIERTRLHGRTARAVTTGVDRGSSRSGNRRIERLDGETGDVHTGFAEIRGDDMRLPADDAGNLDAWNEVARAGGLVGVFCGEVLDVGTIAGYEDAVRRFADGSARWR